MNAPDGRRIFVWRGKDPAEDARRLTETVAEAGMVELFEIDGALTWHHDGQTVGVGGNMLREIVAKLIVTARLLPSGEVEFTPFGFAPGADTSKAPDLQVLMVLMNDLKSMVAKGPSQPVRVPPHLHDAVRQRLATGEPASMIAAAYRVDIAAIRQVAR